MWGYFLFYFYRKMMVFLVLGKWIVSICGDYLDYLGNFLYVGWGFLKFCCNCIDLWIWENEGWFFW